MRIFVTGGTGFIGRPTVRELQKRGHKLLLLVQRRAEGYPARGIAILRGDLSGIEKWKNSVRRFKPDAILHLAWEGIPDYGFEMSAKNLSYGLDVLRLAKYAGCKKIVMAGSCWEYGTVNGAVKEDAPLRITSAFSAAKTALHCLGREFAEENGLEFVWTRFFYVYGPGQKPTSLIPHLVTGMRNGAVPKLKSPDSANDFIYVEDVARALRLILEKHKKNQSDLYNIGSGKLTPVRRVAKLIYGADLTGSAGKPAGFYADISRIGREIGWRPKVGISEGIKKMVSSFN